MDRGAPRARHERRCCMRRTRLLPRAALALALLPLGGVTRAAAQHAARPGISVTPHVAPVVKPAVKPDVKPEGKPEVKPPATPPGPPHGAPVVRRAGRRDVKPEVRPGFKPPATPPKPPPFPKGISGLATALNTTTDALESAFETARAADPRLKLGEFLT